MCLRELFYYGKKRRKRETRLKTIKKKAGREHWEDLREMTRNRHWQRELIETQHIPGGAGSID